MCPAACRPHEPMLVQPLLDIDGSSGENRAVVRRLLEEVIEAESPRLLQIPGVVGVAEGEQGGRPCIVVYSSDGGSGAIPEEVGGYPVAVRHSGEIIAQ